MFLAEETKRYVARNIALVVLHVLVQSNFYLKGEAGERVQRDTNSFNWLGMKVFLVEVVQVTQRI